MHDEPNGQDAPSAVADAVDGATTATNPGENQDPQDTSESPYHEIALDLPARPTTAPRIFQAFNHPLAPPGITSRVYVIYLDTTYRAMRKLYAHEKSLKADYLPPEELLAQGWLELEPGDYLFAACTRINMKKRRPGLDIIKAWATGSEVLDADMEAALEDALEDAMGPADKRTNQKATFDRKTKTFSGGWDVERTRAMKNVKRRGYTMGLSLEKPRNVVAPAASNRIAPEDGDAVKRTSIRSNLVKTTTDVALAGLRRAPPGILEGLKTQADILNSFRLGSSDDGVFTTMQLNISAAHERDYDGVIKDLGVNGKPHFDVYDSPAFLTSHTGISDLPMEYENGCMFLLLARVFTRIDKHRSLKFSGLNYHAGSTATPPEGQQVDPSANRAAAVHYRQRISDNGQARYPLAALPDNSKPIFTTYEMRFPEHEDNKKKLGGEKFNTFANRALHLTTALAFMIFFTRELYCFVAFILRQLDPSLDVQFNCDIFLSSISFVHDGERTTAPPWIYPPGWRQAGASRDPDQKGSKVPEWEDQTQFRQEELDRQEKFRESVERMMPYSVASRKVKPMTDKEIADLVEAADMEYMSATQHTRAGTNAGVDGQGRLSPEHPRQEDVNSSGEEEIEDEEDPEEDDEVEDDIYQRLSYAALQTIFQNITAQPPSHANASDANETHTNNEPPVVEKQVSASTTGAESNVQVNRAIPGQDNMHTAVRAALTTDGTEGPPSSRTRGAVALGRANLGAHTSSSIPTPSASAAATDNQRGRDPSPPAESDMPDGPPSSRTRTAAASGTSSGTQRPVTSVKPLAAATPSIDNTSDSVAATSSRRLSNTTDEGAQPAGQRRIPQMVPFVLLTRRAGSKRKSMSTDGGSEGKKGEEDQTSSGKRRRTEAPCSNSTGSERSRVFRLLEPYSTENLNKEIHVVEDGVIIQGDFALNHARTLPTETIFSTDSEATSHDAIAFIQQLVHDIQNLERRSAYSALNAKSERALMLLAYVVLSRWLDSVERMVRSIYAGTYAENSQTNWIYRLAGDVKEMALSRTRYKSFEAKAYTTSFSSEAATISRRYTLDESPGEVTTSNIKSVIDVLCAWTRVVPPDDRWKLWVVDMTVELFGVGALALHATWNMFTTISRCNVTRKTRGNMERQDLDALSTELRAHILADPSSADARIVREILSYTTGICPTFGSALKVHMAFAVDVNRPSLLDSIASRRLRTLTDFLKRSLTITTNHTDSDDWCPFRECNPARARSREKDGPYHSSVIKTKSGLFSAILWRVITLDTLFAETEVMLYRDSDHWIAHADTIIPFEGESFIGGQFSKAKSLAGQIWDDVNSSAWEILAHSNPTFVEVFEFLYPATRSRVFPGLGPNGAMNISIDLAYGGVCPMPTADEVSHCIFLGNGLTLKAIRYISARPANAPRETRDMISQSLVNIRQHVKENFTHADQQVMGDIDFGFIEHSLNVFQQYRDVRAH